MKNHDELSVPESGKLTLAIEFSAEGYRLRDQELGLEGVGRDLEEAYRDLLAKRLKVVSALEAAAIPYEAMVRRPAISQGTQLRIWPVLLGTGAIVAGVVFAAFVALNPLLVSGERFFRVAAAAAEKMERPAQLLSTVSEGVHFLADAMEKITPEKRQQLLEDLERIAVSGKPFAEQLRPLFEGISAAPTVRDDKANATPNEPSLDP